MLKIIKETRNNDVENMERYIISTKEETQKIENLSSEELEKMADFDVSWVEVIDLQPKDAKTEALLKEVNALNEKIGNLLSEREELFSKIQAEYGLNDFVHYYY